MALEGVIGVDVIVNAGGVIMGQRNATLSFPMDMVDMTTKADYPYKRLRPSWEGPWVIKCDGLLMAGGTGGIATIINTVKSKQPVQVTVTIGDSGEELTGTAYMSNPEFNAPQDGEATMSCELHGDGELIATEGL